MNGASKIQLSSLVQSHYIIPIYIITYNSTT